MADETVLLVEDEPEIRELISLYLTRHGYSVTVAEDGETALRRFEEVNPDLVLLDVVLPRGNGYGVCREIRAVSNVPIIFISCKQDTDDVISGLELGADDYIAKPFDPAVVVARVQANLRRAPLFKRNIPGNFKESESKLIKVKDLEIDPERYRVRRQGLSVNLSAKEIKLLTHMALQPDRFFTTEELYEAVWGTGSNNDTRTVAVHISSLRKKLDDTGPVYRYIENVRGIGYRLVHNR